MASEDRTDGPRAVVIGAGIGGTALTALLAHAGVSVTLLEKNPYLGGSCAGYEKQGFQIDFGTHMFSRGPRGPLGEVLRRCGEPRAVEFLRTHNIAELRYFDQQTDAVKAVAVPSQLYRFPLFAARMAVTMGLNPVGAAQVSAMFATLLTMTDRSIDGWEHRTVEEFVDQFTDNPRVAATFGFLLGLYFVIPPWETSAGEAIYCFQRMIRDNWLSYPRGGAKAIPTTYCRLAEDRGAEVRTKAGVRRILIEDGRARGVELDDGSRIDADIVISTSSVRSTVLHLCDPADLPADYVDRAREIKGSQIAVQAKIALDAELVDAGCLVGALGDGVDLMNIDATSTRSMFTQMMDGRVPDIVPFYCPVPTNFDPSLAPPGHQLLTVCVAAPTNDVTDRDPAPDWEDALMRTMASAVPGLEEHTLFVDHMSVSWMEHWSGKEFAPAISTAQRPDQVGAERPAVTTPVDGFYLAGCGAGGRGVGTELAADSAMECAETILDHLGRARPRRWNTARHRAPSPLHTARNALVPTRVVDQEWNPLARL